MTEPYLPIVVLEELNLHSQQVNPVQLLQVVSDLVASAEAVQVGRLHHQPVLVLERALLPAELFEVELDLAVVRVLDEDRRGPRHVLLPVASVFFGKRVHVLRRQPTLLGVGFEARGVEGELELPAQAAKGDYF